MCYATLLAVYNMLANDTQHSFISCCCSPTRTCVIRALATLVNSPMDEQQFAKALLEEFVIGATTQNIDAMNGLVRGMFTGVRRNCSTTILEVDDATAVTLKSGAVPNSSARSLCTQLTSWR